MGIGDRDIESDDRPEEEGIRILRGTVRFALSQLSSRNGSFEFEEIARLLARMTISRNILVATGPVQAGGDQGRDAETYMTDLPGQTCLLGRELGVTDADGVAIACTLQKTSVLNKFEHDISNVMSSGTPIHFVVAYCESNIPIGDRHKFQTHIQSEFGVHVEIFDGECLLDQLESEQCEFPKLRRAS